MARYHAVQLTDLVSGDSTFGIIETDFRFKIDPKFRETKDSRIAPPMGQAEFHLQSLYRNAGQMGGIYAAIINNTAEEGNPNPACNSLSFMAPCDRLPGDRKSIYAVHDLSEDGQKKFDHGMLRMLKGFRG